MENRRAHERISDLEQVINDHMQGHASIESGVAENTRLTKAIATDTAELVTLVKGIKGFRTLVLWFAPLVALALAAYAWLKSHL